MSHWEEVLVTVHSLPTSSDLSVVSALVLGVAGVVSVALALLGIAAVVRRRTRPYLFIATALLTLSVRTGVAVGSMAGFVPSQDHMFWEHGLDVVMAGLILGAVYYARDADVRNERETAESPPTNASPRNGETNADGFDDP